VKNLLNLENQLTHIYIQPKSSEDNEKIKGQIQKLLGDNFIIKTNAEKNELIYKTSKSEKLIVLLILLFIFLLAVFNLVASITMIYLEKKESISVLKSIGLTKNNVFSIFFLEGILISGSGIFLGVLLGLGICILQLKFSLITIPGGGLPFPVKVNFFEVFTSMMVLITTGTLFSFFTAKFLVRE
jgi:lipoprotein-releasing system permease protein